MAVSSQWRAGGVQQLSSCPRGEVIRRRSLRVSMS